MIAFGLNSVAYQAEIFRSAVQAIPLEQYLTAEAYALTKTQTFHHITLPQALRIALPAFYKFNTSLTCGIWASLQVLPCKCRPAGTDLQM